MASFRNVRPMRPSPLTATRVLRGVVLSISATAFACSSGFMPVAHVSGGICANDLPTILSAASVQTAKTVASCSSAAQPVRTSRWTGTRTADSEVKVSGPHFAESETYCYCVGRPTSGRTRPSVCQPVLELHSSSFLRRRELFVDHTLNCRTRGRARGAARAHVRCARATPRARPPPAPRRSGRVS
jgi:hypothetical protein